VRRLAEEHGISLGEVPGTGVGGRVSKNDILQFIQTRRPAATPPAPQAPLPRPQPLTPAAPQAARELSSTEERIPVSPIRKLIADRMTLSKTTIPHAVTIVEVDMTNVVRFRESRKDEFRQREGVPLSYMAFVIKATVDALKEYPEVNSEWGGDHIILKREININVAVDAPDGLTTPVIHHADDKSLAGLSKAIYDLAMRARSKKLTMRDMQGGTFTVNNTGALGSVWSMSIIPPPQCGILAAAAIVKRPVVVEQDGQDLFAVRHMMNLSFSFDHRILDGGYSAGFVQAVKEKLEGWQSDYPLY
jgi:2-oxoisovalerate dehydrogenase E2 component (dihydrolipoyl transacylase)